MDKSNSIIEQDLILILPLNESEGYDWAVKYFAFKTDEILQKVLTK